MRNFEFLFEYKGRAPHHKGRLRTETHVFAAEDLAEALRLAKQYGETRFHRQKWQVIGSREVTLAAHSGQEGK